MSDILKHKLAQWSPEPPPSVWQGVDQQLANDAFAPLGQRLAAFEATPPQNVWQAIEGDLAHATPVIQLTHRRVWMRYAAGIAAAVLIGYLALRTGMDSSQPDVVQENSVLPSLPIPLKKPAPVAAITHIPTKSKTATIAAQKVPQVSGRSLSAVPPVTIINNNLLQDVVAVPTPSVNEQDLERYIVLETSSATVKLPKKVYNFFRCKDVPDKLACAFRLHDLRMQAASPSLMVTSDFTGLLEMVQHVK